MREGIAFTHSNVTKWDWTFYWPRPVKLVAMISFNLPEFLNGLKKVPTLHV